MSAGNRWYWAFLLLLFLLLLGWPSSRASAQEMHYETELELLSNSLQKLSMRTAALRQAFEKQTVSLRTLEQLSSQLETELQNSKKRIGELSNSLANSQNTSQALQEKLRSAESLSQSLSRELLMLSSEFDAYRRAARRSLFLATVLAFFGGVGLGLILN